MPWKSLCLRRMNMNVLAVLCFTQISDRLCLTLIKSEKHKVWSTLNCCSSKIWYSGQPYLLGSALRWGPRQFAVWQVSQVSLLTLKENKIMLLVQLPPEHINDIPLIYFIFTYKAVPSVVKHRTWAAKWANLHPQLLWQADTALSHHKSHWVVNPSTHTQPICNPCLLGNKHLTTSPPEKHGNPIIPLMHAPN